MRYTTLLFLLVFSIGASAQVLNPVKWSTSFKQISDTEFDLVFTAKMDPGWTIYSQDTSPDGPVPTSFNFENGDHYQRVGKVKEEGHRKEGPDPLFDNVTVIKYVKSPVIFTQRVKVKDLSKPITGYVEFMTCDNERCLPPTEEEFSIQLKAAAIDTKTEPAPAKTEPTQNTPEETPGQLPQTTLVTPLNTNGISPQIIQNPVHWELVANKVAGDQYELVFTAKPEVGWVVYAQNIEVAGSKLTELAFAQADHYKLVGSASEKGHKTEEMDPFFGIKIAKYKEGPVVFTQKISTTDPAKAITGKVYYITCNDRECLPTAELAFSIVPTVGKGAIGEETGDEASASSDGTGNYGIPKPDLQSPVADCGISVASAETSDGKSIWSIFVLGFLGGLIALLTPCVFPMIPLTVSFFTKSSGNRRKGMINASMYGFFIFFVYFLLSIPFHLVDSINPDILNDISTNIWLNLAFFAIFLFFAFSFFGYYEITLPSSWTNRISAAEGVGGMLGVFFMALTLALVSFSCTGPILGSLLAGALSSDGGAWQLTSGMSGFGLALALPFALFAAFPGMMQSLPKSGGWLNSVKVVLGFLELALALKFLSNADLVKHWGLLKIEPFLGLWIIIAIGMALYLFGVIKFPHDSPIKKLSVGRIGIGLATVGFAIYLGSGFIYDKEAGSFRPLKLLSGLAPPVCYSWLQPCDCPQNLSCFKDFEKGLAYAKSVNKPIMIDFTGHACVNCRKMEEHVWPVPGVYKYLKDDYVLISLYVDEKIDLPEDQQIVVKKSTGGTRKLRNYGHKWAHFQTEFFQTNSQPYYVLLSPDGELLNSPVGYTPDDKEYAAFLQCGLDAYTRLGKGKVPEKNEQLGSN